MGQWKWEEGKVDLGKEHIRISYGDISFYNMEEFVQAAIVGPPVDGVFPVEFVLTRNGVEQAHIRDEVERQLNYYLVELGEVDPWKYACYHCGTASNLYSRVHWGWIIPGEERKPRFGIPDAKE